VARASAPIALDSADRHLALRGLQAAGLRSRQPGALFEHELHRTGSRDREGHGHSYAQELEQRILKPLGLDQTELPETRRLPDLDDGGYNPNVPWAAGAIVSNAHDVSRFYSALLSGRILSSASLATMKRTVGGAGLGIWPTELPCGRYWGHAGGILDYQTLVSASEEGDRIAVVSFRGSGYLPPVERALLCAEPRLAAGSAQASWKITFNSGRGPLYVMNADGSGQRWLTLTAAGTPEWSPDGRRSPSEACVTATARSTS